MSQVPVIPGDASNEDVINATNNAIRELNNRDNVLLFKDETGTRTVILDKDGLRTTEPGANQDVYGADNADLTFNSANNVFKIVDVGTTTITGPTVTRSTAGASVDETSVVIPHGLGYTPLILATNTNGGAGYSTLPTLGVVVTWSTAQGTDFLTISTDDTNVTIKVRTTVLAMASGSVTQGPNGYDIKYWLLQETAN